MKHTNSPSQNIVSSVEAGTHRLTSSTRAGPGGSQVCVFLYERFDAENGWVKVPANQTAMRHAARRLRLVAATPAVAAHYIAGSQEQNASP